MTGTIGLLCSRVRVEEKGIIAALAKAGVPGCPVPPTAPMRTGSVLRCGSAEGAPETNTTPLDAVNVLIDRHQDRMIAAAMLPILRMGAAPVLDAGLAAVSTRTQIAAVLEAAGLPRPETVVAFGEDAALTAFDQLGGSATLLPLTPGEASVTLWDHDTAEAVLEHRVVLGSAETKIALLQAGTPTAAERATIIVVGGQAVAVETAGDATPFTERGVLSLAYLAARTLGADIIGIEIAKTAKGWVVWDVQPVPEFRSARSLGDTPVAEAIACLAVATLQQKTSIAEIVTMDRTTARVGDNGGQHVYAAAL